MSDTDSSEGPMIVTSNKSQTGYLGALKWVMILGAVLIVALVGYFGLKRIQTTQQHTVKNLTDKYAGGKASENPEQALKDLGGADESTANPKQLAELYKLRGQSYQTKGSPKEAVAAYEKVLSYDPSQKFLYEVIASNAMEVPDYPKAAEYFERAITWMKEQPKGADELHETHITMLEGRLGEAKNALQ